MSEEKPKVLTLIDQKTVTFYDDELIAVKAEDGNLYVSVRHFCDALGLARQGALRRIRNDEILSDGLKGGNVLLPPKKPGKDGGTQRTNLLRADLIPFFLSGVRVASVKEEVKPKLLTYKKEVVKVLWEAFQEGRLTSNPVFDELLENDTPAVQAYKMIQAQLQLARAQIILEARIDSVEDRLEKVETALNDTGHAISPDQASQISNAVKELAFAMGGHKTNYQAVYGEFNRRFGIPTYKALPRKEFENSMNFLRDWYRRVIK